MSYPTLTTSLQALLDSAIERGDAPGLIAIVFDRKGELASGAAGVRNTATKDPITLDTVCWTASMSKTIVSVAALALVDRMSPRFDLDSHDALAAVLPELKLGSCHPTDTIFVAGEYGGKREVRPAEVGITLRHLLLHTAGFGYEFTSEATHSVYTSAGELPSVTTGHLAAFDTPRNFDAGTNWLYGCSTDWIGRFIERVSGQTLRSAYQTLVFDPLGLPHNIDTFRGLEMEVNRSHIHALVSDGSFVPTLFDTPQFAGVPPEGMATFATAGVWSTIPSFAAFLRSFLNHSAANPSATPLISRALWDDATSDGLRKSGISLPRPIYTTANPKVSCTFDRETTSKGEHVPSGWTMLQTAFTHAESETGRKPGTISWAGLSNSYFWIDSESGIGGILASQFFPFVHPEMIKLRDEFETLVYSSLATT